MCLFVKAITFAPFEISWKTTSSVKFNVVYRGRKHSIKSIAWRKTVLVAFSINLKIRTAWSRRELYHLIAKIDRFNSIERRPLTVLFVTITTLMKSPTSHTNWGSRDDTDVSRSSVHCITKTDLKLNCLKRERVQYIQELTQSNRFESKDCKVYVSCWRDISFIRLILSGFHITSCSQFLHHPIYSITAFS